MGSKSFLRGKEIQSNPLKIGSREQEDITFKARILIMHQVLTQVSFSYLHISGGMLIKHVE